MADESSLPGASMTQTYKSVAAYARGRFRILDEGTDLFFFPGIHNEEVADDTLAATGISETVLNLLRKMDRKLDQLLVLTQESHLAPDFPFTLQAFQIGGNGILFRSEAALKPGDRLEIVLFLSGVPLRIAGGIGHITGAKTTPYGRVWDFSFTRLRESDLDAIMRFVFQEERQKIREIKMS